MISFGNAASSHRGLIPLKRGELLWAIGVRRILLTYIQLLLLQFLLVTWPTPTNFAFFKKLLDKFFYKFDNPEINRQ